MPGDGSSDGWDQPAAYDQEVETPYYYSTRFDDSLIRTEFTPTAHCGYFRFTFPSGKPVVLLANRQGGELSASDDNSISGRETFVRPKRHVAGHHARICLRRVQCAGENSNQLTAITGNG